MKFHKGQQVICISKLSEWDYTIPNFDEQLKIALKINKMPEQGKTYEVEEPLALHYKTKCYIKLQGFENNIFDEKGFVPTDKFEASLHNEITAKKAFKFVPTDN